MVDRCFIVSRELLHTYRERSPAAFLNAERFSAPFDAPQEGDCNDTN
jgi:hypothetical protein